VEAQGIEPWSEPAFSAASTCVGRCLRVVPGRSSANLPGTNLRIFSPAASEGRGRPARFCVFDADAPDGLRRRRCL